MKSKEEIEAEITRLKGVKKRILETAQNESTSIKLLVAFEVIKIDCNVACLEWVLEDGKIEDKEAKQ